MAVSLLIRNGYLPEEIGEQVVDVSSQLHAALQMKREDKPDMRGVADKVTEAYAKFVVVRSELEREHKEAVKCVKSNRKLPAGYDTLEVYMRYIASKFTVLRGMASRVD
jgi:predicted lipoprotein